MITLFTTNLTKAQISTGDFVTTWKTDNPGLLPDTVIRIPTFTGVYNYDIDWDNDGVFDEFGKTGNAQHDYGTAGTYTVRIRGQFPHFYINDDPNMKEKLLSVDQWGSIAWSSLFSSFFGANNLVINATDVPDLSNVINMNNTFVETTSFNQSINNWDVSNVRFMNFTFSFSVYNQPLNNWNVSNVESMRGMFQFNDMFNQPLDMWDVSAVEDMSFMFNFTEAFNQNINNWDVGNVTDMTSMFREANLFNSPINSWNVSNVTDMYNMFFHADVFNQPLNSWDVVNVVDMERMFNNADQFNQPLNNWNVSNVMSMRQMFTQTSLDQDLSSWDVSNVNDMAFMFQGLTLSTENYDAILNAWVNLQLQNNVSFHGGNSNYCNSETARNTLINVLGWTITDGGLDCSGLSISEFSEENIKLYPNPVTTELNIDVTNGQIDKIKIFSLDGKLISYIPITDNKINLERLVSGIYFIEISKGESSIVKKIVKQ
ncbi:hypothetical protein GCM10011531_06940 [Aquaticitalea lipolytica]|uniref:Secretion system C-terminal sorting domain-containing protein n=1 Tax=Aquaticitalea lipolytica TaxID=1247562 RepID=A0A8J2XFM0_9FLAO|nr:hypothetical protein GCM10011531_06940 [Aquaticitalea lipolytica]